MRVFFGFRFLQWQRHVIRHAVRVGLRDFNVVRHGVNDCERDGITESLWVWLSFRFRVPNGLCLCHSLAFGDRFFDWLDVEYAEFLRLAVDNLFGLSLSLGYELGFRERMCELLAYSEPVVIFVLRAGTRDSKFADVLKILQDLLQGIMFCRKRGVLAFSTPHILIFAEFAKPDGKLGEALRGVFAARKLKPAPEAAPAQK